jgi:hypothetical protein
MRPNTRWVAVAATAALAAGIAGAHDDTRASAAPGGRVLVFAVGDGGEQTFVDERPRGESPGDGLVATGVPLRHDEGGRRAGRMDVLGVLLTETSEQLTLEIGLPRGSLHAEGVVRAGDPRLAVTGGTGRFAGARGVARLDERTRRLTIRLLP